MTAVLLRQPEEAAPPPAGRGAYLLHLMEWRGVPRNQLASLSGLTNTYIRDLEGDRILNVPRENLIFFGAALNLSLPQIDEVLLRFDRAPLSGADVPTFLALPERIHLSHALHPCHSVFYELIALSFTKAMNRTAQVGDKPSAALRGPGYRLYFDRHVLASHPIHGDLVEAVGAARLASLRECARKQPMDHYVNLDGLKAYAAGGVDQQDRAWRVAHMRNLLALLDEAPRFRLHLTAQPPNFSYWLSLPRRGDKAAVVFEGQSAPGHTKVSMGRLTGFASTNPPLVRCFTEDLAIVERSRLDGYEERQAVIDLVESLAR